LKAPYPENPTIVFAGANNLRRIHSLRDAPVDAVMTSFEYIGKGHYMTKVAPTLKEWPVPLRTYLDSGVFTFVRKAGTTRIRIARAGPVEEVTPQAGLDEFKLFAASYEKYLKEYGEYWDHIIELDIDEIAATVWYETKEPKPYDQHERGAWAERGREWAMDIVGKLQDRLRDIVGDRLMPAWHVQRGPEGWTEMLRKFPYVSIGSDTGVATSTGSTRPPMQTAILRRMVQEAHNAGVGVHYLGDTRFKTFIEAELDSADSTTWVSAGRFGQFPGPKGQSIRYTTKNDKGLARQKLDWQRTVRPIDMSRARQFEDLMRSWGIDPEKILDGSQEERLGSNIALLMRRQEEIRRARQAPKVSQ
jgi:hypothetical protein